MHKIEEMSPFHTEDDREKFRDPSCEIPIEIYTFLKSLSNLTFRNLTFRKKAFKNPISLPARNGVSFFPGHRPPSDLGVNGYLVEDYEFKGIIAN